MFVRNYQKGKVLCLGLLCVIALIALFFRLVYIMLAQGEYYTELATNLHEREREIKAARGKILDRNGVVLADNISVCTISVIYSQILDPEAVIQMLVEILGLSEDYVREKVSNYSAREKILSNVPIELGDQIRALDMPGVKVDEDYKRSYPFDELASKVLGFTGADNQGILGLEVEYEEYLAGEPGKILTMTDAVGMELQEEGERREEPVAGMDITTTLDINIQNYATQLALQAYETKEAAGVMVLVMDPNNGEMLACVSVPEFNLNEPYELTELWTEKLSEGLEEGSVVESSVEYLNQMWRNPAINDSYEPGSTFKILTAAAALEEGVVSLDDSFHCPGYIMVGDRRISCHETEGHGTHSFVDGIMTSCNPVFISLGLRLGVDNFYGYFQQFLLDEKTGIDLPGESGTIVHQEEDMGEVELATMSFGQSFQITPIQLLTSVSSIINGGTRVTPHFGSGASGNGEEIVFSYEVIEDIIMEETSETMKDLLELVVSEGSGKNAAVEGFSIGGKTATSQTLPRGNGKYISSFIGFAPAQDPEVIALAIITHPQGVYYGGQIAAPIVRQLFENILPYLEEKDYNKIQ